MRLLKIDCWGCDAQANQGNLADTQLGILLDSASSGDPIGDQAEYHDVGTAGMQRPQLHIIPSFQLREHWFSFATTEKLMTVSLGPTRTWLNLSLQLDSIPLTTAPSIRRLLDPTKASFDDLSEELKVLRATDD